MKKMTYESGMEELQALADRIESGELTLEETLKAYEKGCALAEKLSAILQEGRGRVEKLEKDGSRTPFDAEEQGEE
ncbi:MAG: exodeoxyribonuclease VII small subunit [Candidatus Spyradocola sp.]|jgi:exodeoxyribonuclease VII small subunit